MKNTHGGRRQGAGRKSLAPLDKKKSVALTINARVIRELDKFAKSRKMNRSESAEMIIKQFLKYLTY